MIPVDSILFAAFSFVATFAIWKLFKVIHHEVTSPLRNLRGPKPSNWFYGNLQDMWNAECSVLQEEWVGQFGSTLAVNGLFNRVRLFTVDTRAISHILSHSEDYQKPFHVRYNLAQVLGEGLIFVEGAQHRQQAGSVFCSLAALTDPFCEQRHIMNPAFGPTQIRALTDTFVEKAVQLRDVWSSEVAKDPSGTTTGVRFDVVQWLSKTTLNVIGRAGFNFDFNALDPNGKQNEMSEAFATIAEASQTPSVLSILRAWIPPLRLLPDDRARRVQVAQHTMIRIGRELLSSAKAAARASLTENGPIEKNSSHGRDLLSLLVKANMATDVPESQRLSDEHVLAQVPTFLVAGYETTSMATTWALYAMSIAPGIQTRLRGEVTSIHTENPTMDELMALPYLDAVVRETLRVYSPIPNAVRIAMKDDILPVEKPFKDKGGVIRDSIRIRKGDMIVIPILAVNMSKELWGADAHEFKPERWESVPESVSRIPGVWGHLMTFLGGPRACIGYRFSLIEMKALLFTLVRAFEFELAVPASEISRRTMVVQQPVLRGDPKGKAQLPLLVRPCK